MMYYASALLLGFLGSFHCAGMCGPIALALPLNRSSRSGIITGRLIYNTGRIITYMLLGFVAGLIGHGIAWAGFQKGLSLVSGILILLIAMGSLYLTSMKISNPILTSISAAIRKPFRKLFRQHSYSAMLGIGLLNGILPCGFVYMATVAAAASGNLQQSVGYMAFFGAGTLPVMFFLSIAGNFFGLKFNRMVKKATPFVAMAVAIFLISRGLTPVYTCCHH